MCWLGWARGHAIIYAPDAIHIENIVDLDGDPVTGKWKLSEKALAGQREYWDCCAPAIVEYYNPGLMRCYHDIVWAYYGEPCQKPVNCCEAPGCHLGPPVDLDKKTYEYAKKLAKGNSDLPKYDKEMTTLRLKHLMEWREDIWVRHGTCREARISNLNPPNFIITNHALSLLTSAIHQATTEEHTLEVLDQWIETAKLDLSMEERSSLIPIVSTCNTHWKAKQDHTQGQKEGKMRKATEAHKWLWAQGKDMDDYVFDHTREVVTEPTSAEVLGQRHAAGKWQIKLTTKAMNANVHGRD